MILLSPTAFLAFLFAERVHIKHMGTRLGFNDWNETLKKMATTLASTEGSWQ